MSFKAGGLISGLDTNSIIDQLVKIDRFPITKLQAKKSGFKSQISALGRVKSSINGLITAAKNLDTANEVLALKGTSTDTDAFTATALGSAAPGSYSIEISNLAVAAKKRSTAFSDSNTAAVQAGTLTFAIKEADPVEVTIAEGDTLQDVAFSINQTVEGVSATIIFDGTSSYLSLTNDETGHAVGSDPSTAMKVTEVYTGTTGTELGLTEIQAATNAKLTIDGLSVESDTNKVTNAISGVTIKLLDTTSKTETLAVAADPEQVSTNVKKLVTAYNDVLTVLAKETTITQGTNRNATLGSDPTLRSLRGTLSQLVTGAISSLSSNKYDSLASIGITTSSTGQLSVTSSKLEEALAANLTGVGLVFTADDGIADTLVNALKPYVDLDGILANREDGINRSVKAIDKRVESMELRLEKYRLQLVRQFSKMETALSTINQQQSSLAGIV